MLNIARNLAKRFERFIWSPRELIAMLKIRKSFKSSINSCQPPMVVVVEGFLGMKFVALYFTFLMLTIGFLSNRTIRVVVFTNNRRSTWLSATRLYRILFPTTFIAINQYLTTDEQCHIDEIYKSYVRDVRSVDDLFALERGGIRLGRDIYYAHIRRGLNGTVSILDNEIQELTKLYISNLLACEKMISEFKPELLLITHNSYASYSPFFYTFLKHNIPVALTVPVAAGTGRVCGRMYSSLLEAKGETRGFQLAFNDATWKLLLEEFSAEEDKGVDIYLRIRFSGDDPTFNGDYHKHTSKLSKEQMCEKLSKHINDQRKVILIAAHLLWDDPGYKSLYRDYEIWIRDTLLTIKDNPKVFWVVKAHPSENHMGTHRTVKHIVEEIFAGILPEHIRFLDSTTDINTYSLIDFASAIVTVRGTIGFEAACKGKRVITAGYGPYTGLGFSRDFELIKDYRGCLMNIHEIDTDLSDREIHLARIGLYGYFVKKMPVSKVILRGDKIASYSNLTKSDLLDDATLVRFAKAILSKESGDLM